MNQSLTTKKIPVKRSKISSLRSRTMIQDEPSFKTQPRSKFRSSFALSSLCTPRNMAVVSRVDTRKISRISNLPSPRQTITPLSTRFAANQTRKLLELYTNLKQNYHDFSFDVPEKLFDCEFSRQFSRFTTSFDVFSRQISCLYGTVNPKNTIKNSSAMITSSLHQATKSLMAEWIDFIERLNNISEEGISPHISMTNSNLTILFQNLATISTIILVDKFKGEEAGQIVRLVSGLCIKIKDNLVAEYSKPKSQRFTNFDITLFEEDCRRCSQLTVSLFEQNLPPNSFTLTEMLSIKSGIITSLSAILQILRSAIHFEEKILKLKKSIIAFNSELSKVESNANLQFQIELSLEETQTDLLGDFDSLENDSKKKDGENEDKDGNEEENDQNSQKSSDEQEFFETEKKDDDENGQNDEKDDDNEAGKEAKNEIVEEEEELDFISYSGSASPDISVTANSSRELNSVSDQAAMHTEPGESEKNVNASKSDEK